MFTINYKTVINEAVYEGTPRRKRIIESTEFCCNIMKDHWQTNIYLGHGVVVISLPIDNYEGDYDESVPIGFCPWCGKQILVNETKKQRIVFDPKSPEYLPFHLKVSDEEILVRNYSRDTVVLQS